MAQPLNIAQVRAAADKNPAFVDVPVPDWGGDVRLRKLRATQLVEFQAILDRLSGKPVGRETLKKPGKKVKPPVTIEGTDKIEDFYVQLIAMSAVDAGGRRIFEQAADFEHLRNSPNVLIALGLEAMKLNGFNEPGDSAKNSATTTDAG